MHGCRLVGRLADLSRRKVKEHVGDTSHILLWPCLVRKIFQDSGSYRIFGRIYRVLNINENKN